MICVSISGWQQLDLVLASGAGFLELRLDLIRKDPADIFSRLKEGMKTLVTCRPEVFSETERLQLLKTSMDLGATYVDLELESAADFLDPLAAHARRCGTKLIVSHHNFELTPQAEALEILLKSCYERGGDLAKIAVQVHSLDDVNRLLRLYSLPGRKVILGMGALGRITRVMGPYLGAEFTFAAPVEGEETAPGQLSYKQLKEIYNVIDAS
jgi:3-dehydroquinate dehydratase type I